MTYQDLVNANSLIKTTEIKGKHYAEVAQRIKAFRSVFPEGSIQTEIVEIKDGICVMRATIYNEAGFILGTGTAFEEEESSFINKTSYIENCETSAVGRALGMCGFGIDTSVASYDEVSNAIVNQERKKIVCADCGNPIVDKKSYDGSVWKATAIKEYSERRFKKCLCPDCQRKAMKEEGAR